VAEGNDRGKFGLLRERLVGRQHLSRNLTAHSPAGALKTLKPSTVTKKNAADVASAAPVRSSDQPSLCKLQLAGLLAAAAAIILEHKGDPIPFAEAADTSPLQRRYVHEHVVTASIGLNEAEALGRVEKFHRPSDPHADILSEYA
jgi:hypothetical protein